MASYADTIDRLVDLSANGHDAYDDVDWELPLDPEDPRLRLPDFDPLARTLWYQQLPPPRQSEVGLVRAATQLRVGWEFENLLQQGLLARAYRMRNANASFRYLHTEVMEESQHTLMFFEFVRRHASHARGMPQQLRILGDVVVHVAARRLPALFYFMVLGGEIPIDHVQRLALKTHDPHPLLHRIIEIHVEEEARHVSFANTELRRIVPRLGRADREALAVAVPGVLRVMAPLMVQPTPWLVRHYNIPRRDLRQALEHPESQQLVRDSVARIRKTCEHLDLLTPAGEKVWAAVGLVAR